MATKQWIKTPFAESIKEFEAVCLALGEKRDLEENLKNLEEAYKKARPVQLSRTEWSWAQNTRSWEMRTIDQMIRLFKKDRPFDEITEILKEIYNPRIKCPIFMRQDNTKLYLIEGEIRLMVARVLKLNPIKCIILEPNQ